MSDIVCSEIFYCACFKINFICILKRETRQTYFDVWKNILLPKKYQASTAPQQLLILPHHGPNSGLVKTGKASERDMSCHCSSSPFVLPHYTRIVVPKQTKLRREKSIAIFPFHVLFCHTTHTNSGSSISK